MASVVPVTSAVTRSGVWAAADDAVASVASTAKPAAAVVRTCTGGLLGERSGRGRPGAALYSSAAYETIERSMSHSTGALSSV